MRGTLALALLTLLCARGGQAQDAALDRAFEAFWDAGSSREAEKAAQGIAATGAPFAAILERLAAGRAYASHVDTGEIRWPTLPGGGMAHATTVVVPKDYNPARRYPVRLFLHGGVARPDPEEGDEWSPGPSASRRPRRRLDFDPRYIAVYPSGYAQAQWWFSNQMTNLGVILDRLKRVYNVDENRVHLMGVSDGGTGTLYVGLKDPTPWSVFFPLNGYLRVLANPAVGAEGELFPINLTQRPVYAVNGEVDPLYPAAAVYPTLLMLERAGGRVIFRPMPGAGHNTSWWSSESPAIDAYEEAHPRNPLPDSLAWETERTDRFNRMAWLVVDRLDASRGAEVVFPDDNTLELTEPLDFGLRVDSRRGDGRRIIQVLSGTTASAMGMMKGDIVVRMDDAIIQTAEDMGRAFDRHPPGTPLVFVVERGGRPLTMEGLFPPPPKPARRERLFEHSRPSGRIAITRRGNVFEARCRGVGAFTLLLSPLRVDFDQPVRVVVNGRVAFEGAVARSVPTLLRWAARDNDRTMLFGAELPVSVS